MVRPVREDCEEWMPDAPLTKASAALLWYAHFIVGTEGLKDTMCINCKFYDAQKIAPMPTQSFKSNLAEIHIAFSLRIFYW